MLITSVFELHTLSEKVLTHLGVGSVLGLSGPLGAGKTEFSRGLLKAAGWREVVQSPSYVLEICYDLPSAVGPLRRLRHLDCYRLSGSIEDTGLEVLDAADDEIVLVEWPEKIDNFQRLLSHQISINFAPLGDPKMPKGKYEAAESCRFLEFGLGFEKFKP